MAHAPGAIRDVVLGYLSAMADAATVAEIHAAVEARLGVVPASSVRSCLNLNTPDVFQRIGRGQYPAAAGRPCRADAVPVRAGRLP